MIYFGGHPLDTEAALRDTRKELEKIRELAKERMRASECTEDPEAKRHWRIVENDLLLCYCWLNCLLQNHGF